MSDTLEKTEYYLRFISMYIDLCTEVIYQVFVYFIPNNDTAGFFRSNSKLFYDLEKRKILSKAEISFVVSSSPKPEQFDLSLLIKILCNSKTTLTPPLNGWDRQPRPSDLSIAADLLRLRKIRNIIIGHRPRAKLPKYKFDRLWEEVEGILLRLANATDPSSEEGLREKIEYYRIRPLQTQDEKTTFYLDKLQEWWQTCEEVSGLQKKVEDLLQTTQEIALYFKTKPQNYCRYIRLLFDGGRSVLSGILKKELSSIGLDLQAVLLGKASQLETNFINKEMHSQVFPQQTNPNTDYNSWDILTLTTVTMHAFRNSLSEDVVEEIKIIDTALKNYAQTAIESLDSTMFQFCCEDLVSSVKSLSNYVGGETKTNCKMLIEAYRQLDDADVDVDNYLNQMTRYASEIKTIPAIYKKTIADLKECASQMIERGVVFEREKAMDMKMVVIGRNKVVENLAEEILETVWQSALEMSDSPEEFSSVRLVVDKILEEVRKIPSVQTTKVARHCIILTIRYSSWEALLEILKYTESRSLCEHFEDISRELEYICGEMLVLSGNVTVESIQSIMNKLDEHTPRKDSSIQIAFSCFSVESMGTLFSLFKSDNTMHLFSNLDGALSECVGDEIHVHATTDMKGFCDLFDSQEVLTTEGSSEAAIGYQPSEPDDPLQKVHSSEQTSEAASSFQPSEAEDPLQKVSTSSGSDALYGIPWTDKAVSWHTRDARHQDEDLITNFEQLIRAFLQRREGRAFGIFVSGHILTLVGFYWVGLLFQILSFLLFVRQRTIFRILRKIKRLQPLLESPFMKQVLQQIGEERTKHSLKEDIENYEPLQDLFRGEVHFPHVNILLMGPVGVGKSSFFNTINSIFRGKIFNIARSGSSEHSLTTKFRRYPVISNSGNREMKFCLCDAMGLEQNHLMDKMNMKYLLDGHLHDKFMLDPSSSLSPVIPGFKKQPALEDQIHCVALVIDASTVDAVDAIKDVIQNIKEMQTVMNSLDIPQVVILTNVDKVCVQTKKDVSNALKSKTVAQTVGKVSEMFGRPQRSIYPVKNYESECELDPNIDTLALLALKGILSHADAFLFMHKEEILQMYS